MVAVGQNISSTLAYRVLYGYDKENNAHLVETLRAYLDEFGDVTTAAARVFVHPNTFRYRLRRLVHIGQVDLRDPEARFALMLQLRSMVGR